MFLDDSACNLASLNLMRFRRPDGEFDVESLQARRRGDHRRDGDLGRQRRPTRPRRSRKNSHEYRPLGLGYANLGALLMSRGLPYDSDEGRAYAAAVTALMCGQAYATSARIAASNGAVRRITSATASRSCASCASTRPTPTAIDDRARPVGPALRGARRSWADAVTLGTEHGFRNAQATVLAPTGTIAFMMDCDTTGIEPDLALVKYKKLVGGGMFKIVNNSVPLALKKLGYDHDDDPAHRRLHQRERHDRGLPRT